MKIPLNNYLVFISFLLGIHVLQAQQKEEKFMQENNYLIYLPENYNEKDTQNSWPLLLFLHGAGEIGTDIEKIKGHGLPRLIKEGKQFPFIVVSPQANKFGWQPDILYELLQNIKTNYKVDNERVYLTGLSMGGAGTWDLAIKYPEEFAAIIPICGRADTSKIWRLRNMPVWCFHGDKDEIVPFADSWKMINSLKNYNPSARLTVYPGVGHDSWTATYENDSIYRWLLSHKRFRYTEKEISGKLLEEYQGTYVSAENDTIILIAKGKKLQLDQTGRILFELKAASDNLFFVNEDSPHYTIIFHRDFSGKVISFTYFSNREKLLYIKTK